MKKYQHCFPCYGQSVAGRIAYLEKMGVANGVIDEIKRLMRNKGMSLNDWKSSFDIGNGKMLEETLVTVVVPTPYDIKELLHGYPTFEYCGKRGYIDMIHFGGELQVHFMFYNREEKVFENGGWHTVRESLNLEDTCTLYEYVEDRLEELVILSLEDKDKYNSTGALGIGI